MAAGDRAALVERLVQAAIDTCEPEDACDKARAYTQQVLTRKFTDILAGGDGNGGR